ncbi:carbon starvation CstA family protein [uncultured Treponema sp.]|uniref:carbon starvation CstA family protein n=1 Tax=uncultured Treponema sp. TaxID=162155 RepID=UPI0025CCC8EF|nr:carbon starvation CstA family protein [uncultured Treponema sp.]MBQ7537675.1 carbon starvation protein A [Treponema sp.]
MVTFFVALAILIGGYFVYGALVEKIFKPTENPTPAIANPDGVDYVPIPAAKAFLIQLLNIAGLGPIFGAISGAMWGPSVYIWIVLGTLLAGAVHDFTAGMLSERNDGASISEVTGKYLGPVMHNVMRVFSVILLVLVGVVFMVGPAGLLAKLTSASAPWLNIKVWTIIILCYYFLATLLPIDKIIGRVYPVFGVLLILMAFGIIIGTMAHSGERPMMELTLKNLYPGNVDGTGVRPIWPLMFITVACGAISGFHATQSPIVSRCIKSEKDGRRIFYGAMVAEGIIALIWASAAVAFFWNKDGSGTGLSALKAIGGGNSSSVYEMCVALLGKVGGPIALLGVIVCPITSGDTAFRSARMTIFDWFKLDEKKIKVRLGVAIPLLLIGYAISFINYNVVWRYFSWSNQTLAMIVLWAGAVYLATNYENKNRCWIAACPATFMSAVSITYLMYAPECINLGAKGAAGLTISYTVGVIAAVAFLAIFLFTTYRNPAASLERQKATVIGRKEKE